MIKSSKGTIILDCQIKTHDGWVARVKFLHETVEERVQAVTTPHNKNILDLHVKLSHPSKFITHATTKAAPAHLNNMKIVP